MAISANYLNENTNNKSALQTASVYFHPYMKLPSEAGNLYWMMLTYN